MGEPWLLEVSILIWKVAGNGKGVLPLAYHFMIYNLKFIQGL